MVEKHDFPLQYETLDGIFHKLENMQAWIYEKRCDPSLSAADFTLGIIDHDLELLKKAVQWIERKETFTLFKFCQNCHTVLTCDVEVCPVCKNPRVRGNCSQVWLRSKDLVDV